MMYAISRVKEGTVERSKKVYFGMIFGSDKPWFKTKWSWNSDYKFMELIVLKTAFYFVWSRY